MCGRYTNRFKWKQLHRLATLTTPSLDYPPSYNAAPGQDHAVLRLSPTGALEVAKLRWGLPVSWTPEPVINAKAETVAEKKTFRDALRHRRCLVPADGFYEWMKLSKGKQPYLFQRKGGEPFAMPGIIEKGVDRKTGEVIDAFVVLTTTPNELVAPLHGRMPVMLTPEEGERWLLDPATPLGPFPAEAMESFPVSRRMNDPQQNDAALLEPVEVGNPCEERGLFDEK